MLEFREAYNTENDLLEELLAELQEHEREFEPYHRTGSEMKGDYLSFLRKECEARDGKIIVAILDHKLVGFVCVWRGEQLDEYMSQAFEIGYVSDLVVSRDFRGKGIGSSLIEQAEKYCLNKEFRRLKIGALSRNVRTKELYNRFGYVDYDVQFVKDFTKQRV